MKLLSLGLAFLLWFIVRGERKTEITREVAVELMNKPDWLAVIGEVDAVISLTLVGPHTRLSRIDKDYFEPYKLDLKKARKGVNTFFLHDDNFKVPHGVHITRMVPQAFRLILEEAVERLIPNQPQFVGQLEEGFELVGYNVSPSHSKLSIGKSQAIILTSLSTEPIMLAGKRASFEGEFSLMVHEFLQNPQEKRKVFLKVIIREKRITKIFKGIRIETFMNGKSFQVEPTTVLLKANGLAGKIASLHEEDLKVGLNVPSVKSRRTKRRKSRVRVIPPKIEGIEILTVPDTVWLTLH